MSDLSLFDIDSQLHDLLTQWQEAPADQLECYLRAVHHQEALLHLPEAMEQMAEGAGALELS